jgi:hypothetical protein
LFYAFGDLQKERSAPKFRSLRDGANTLGQGQLAGIAVGQMRDRTIVCCVSDRTLNSYILGPDGNVLQTVNNFLIKILILNFNKLFYCILIFKINH